MENVISISPELPGNAYDGSLTYVGVLRRYFVDYDELGNNNGITKHCNDDTKKSYLSDYENRHQILQPYTKSVLPLNYL